MSGVIISHGSCEEALVVMAKAMNLNDTLSTDDNIMYLSEETLVAMAGSGVLLQKRCDNFFLNSDCTVHLTSQSKFLQNYKWFHNSNYVYVENGKTVEALESGDILLSTFLKTTFMLQGV